MERASSGLRNSENSFIGFTPIIAWEIFSILYYGFPFPNTYYAKLTTGIAQSELYHQGWFYFQNSLKWDYVTLPTVFVGLLTAFISRESRRIALGLGILLYFSYILRIGGDFMSGRFFSTVFILSIALLISSIPDSFLSVKFMPAISLVIFGVIILAGLSSLNPILLTHADSGGVSEEHGIADEKLIYFNCCGLLNHWGRDTMLKVALDAQKSGRGGARVAIRESIGVFGYYARPDLYILDRVSLGDPLRARLPVIGPWRIGHFEREIPDGYIETIDGGFQNQIQDPHLHAYYDKLLLITRGKRFSPERLRTILEMNLGKYDYLIDAYVQKASP